MSNSVNAMRDQILATPSALAGAFDEMERVVRLILTTPEIYRARRIVLTGSGDSYFAAKAVELALLQHTGLPIEVRPPLEAGRYHAQLSSARDLENTLVIAISNSGAAARVTEAARLYRECGALVLAVTKDPASRLAGVASRTLVLPVPPLPSAPGFGPFLFAVVALLLLGIRIGEVRLGMTMDEAQALRRQLQQGIASLAEVVGLADEHARSAAAGFAQRPVSEVLGAGPGFAVADYGAAKLLEAAGRHSYARELEEWAHLNYFDARPDEIATTLIIAADSRAQSRAVELLGYLDKLGRSITVVGGGPAADVATSLGHRVILVTAAVPELWSPLLLSAPVALIAAHLAEMTGAAYGRSGDGRWSDSANAATVQKSAVWEPRG
ncbi:MAG: SIS domain-containing protein [Devosia sp.]|nr:SIS domain-containing protein [Devosia sp.]